MGALSKIDILRYQVACCETLACELLSALILDRELMEKIPLVLKMCSELASGEQLPPSFDFHKLKILFFIYG